MRRLRAHWLLVPAVAALMAVAAQAQAVRLAPVASGFDQPLFVTAAPGDASRLFVVEQTGRIRIVKDGALQPQPFLNLAGSVSCCGERGLLGLAFHPDYQRNGRFYVDYTNRAGDTRVVEYRVSSNPDRARPGGRVILAVHQPFANHNGGMLAFGPDGKLYVGLGDGGSGGDPFGNGQSPRTLLGKILRIDVDRRTGSRPYGIPPDNPFVGRAGVRPEIDVLGVRNPWRFSFDRRTRDLWIGDVGQGTTEEVDVLTPARARGANLGWNRFEGRGRFSNTRLTIGHLVQPVAQYSHAVGCSITGGYVYRGTAVPALAGRYLYADYCSGRIWSMRAGRRPGGVREITGAVGGAKQGITSFGQDNAGEVYLVAGDTVYRFAS